MSSNASIYFEPMTERVRRVLCSPEMGGAKVCLLSPRSTFASKIRCPVDRVIIHVRSEPLVFPSVSSRTMNRSFIHRSSFHAIYLDRDLRIHPLFHRSLFLVFQIFARISFRSFARGEKRGRIHRCSRRLYRGL